MTAALPWAKPRYELLLLVLVAIAALLPVQRVNSQDVSRMCATDSFVHLHLSQDACLATRPGVNTVDRASYGGHLYSNKAPGMSVLAIPAYELAQLPQPAAWHNYDLRLWLVRALTAGVFFVFGTFLVGRVAEGLAPGFGAPTLVTFALGTLAFSFAASNFDHVPAMTLGFVAFLLLWRRLPLASGLVAGLGLLVEYEEAPVVLALLAYGLWLGRGALRRYVIGVAPGALLLGAYDWRAFGAPWHTALTYSDNLYTNQEDSGLLGVHMPNLHATRLVFVGDRGLLFTSPVLVLAAAGLILLWRRGLRAETLVCAAVTAAYLIAECGYFIPYGGLSPGPRFVIPALAFLSVGLGPAFARWPRLTTLTAAASIVAQTALALTWSVAANYPGTVWTQIWHMLRHHTNSFLFDALAKNVLQWVGLDKLTSAIVVCAVAAAAFAVAATASLRRAQ
jgi:hypothetical protein